ncbi:MAG: sulfate permease [Desulfovibrionaceae bacterium]|nr:sulfate permease [Desulfovibrionaceae bacterium]
MAFPFKFRPKLFDCFRNYSVATLRSDVSAGVTVGIIALPMAMAFAIGSNVTPAAGIITAVIAGFLTSFFGGSKVSIGGPTGAFVAIVAGIVASYGLPGLLICTMMAGVMLFLMGLARVGGLIRYIPAPLIRGFTTGIAVIILTGQIKDFLGIKEDIGNASNIIATFDALLPHLKDISLPTVIVATVSLLGIYMWPKRLARIIPGSIAMLLLITGATVSLGMFMELDIATIGSKFGGIPGELPYPRLPHFNLEVFQELLTPAVTIAMLGAIESLLCATAADGMIDDEHDPDQELMAQGIANFVTPLFGGIPTTGAIARTAANIRSGGKTPIAGIVHALVLLLIMLVAAPLAKFIPLSVLSAVLIMVGINMGDWREFVRLSRYPRSDATVFLVTFLLTIIFGLTQAVMVGMFIACVLFIKRMSDQSSVGIHPMQQYLTRSFSDTQPGALPQGRTPQDDVLVVRISGAMFFGAANKLKNILLYLKHEPKVLIIKMTNLISLDATAILTLDEIIYKCQKKDIVIIFVGLDNQPRASLSRAGLLNDIPKENILDNLEQGLDRADEILKEEQTPAQAG